MGGGEGIYAGRRTKAQARREGCLAFTAPRERSLLDDVAAGGNASLSLSSLATSSLKGGKGDGDEIG